MLRRVCVVAECRETAMGRAAKRCARHHREAMRAWRARRRAAGASTAPTAPTAPSASPEAVRERVRLSRARARGAIQPGPCAACGVRRGVVALRVRAADTKPVWGCRGCRAAIVGTAQAVRDDRDAREVAARTADALEATLARIAELPADVVATLEAEATGGSLPSRPGSPLYLQRLAILVRKYVNP